MARKLRKREFARHNGHTTEQHRAKLLDDLVEFEDFKEILASIRKDLKAGMSEEKLRDKYAPLVQARMLTVALTDEDASKAVTAAKDILDRKEGKAKERSEVHHKLENLKDEELDSLILSKLSNFENTKNKQ